MNQQDARQRLLHLANQNRPYEFLHEALLYLSQEPGDAQIRLFAVRSFAEIGLFGPAVELIDDRPDLLNEAPDLAATVEALRQQPTGLVPWSDLDGVFDRNLSTACERFATCRANEQALRDATVDLELFRCGNGNLLLSRRRGDGPRQWLPGMVDWPGMVASCDAIRPDRHNLCMPFLVEGVGMGHFLRALYDHTKQMFLSYTPLIHVFETNLAQLAAWLHAEDVRDILADERFLLWAGADGAEGFLQYHRDDRDQVVPLHVLRLPGWGPAAQPVASAALDRLNAEVAGREDEHRAAIDKVLATRSNPDEIGSRFAARHDRPLRILGVTSRFTTFLQYSMRDIEETARHLGHELRVLIEPHDHTPVLRRESTLAHIREFMPDLILVLDHNRKEYTSTYDFAIPYCNWIQDDLPNLFGPGSGEGLHPYDLIVGLVGHNRIKASGYPKAQCRFLPTPVRVDKFSNEPVSESDRAAHACDVSFVSHLHFTREELLRECLSQVEQPELRRLIEAQYERFAAEVEAGRVPGTYRQMIGWIRSLATELDLVIDEPNANRLRQLFTERLINACYREQVLQWASEMGLNLHIYGKGWERHPTLAKHARGPAEHGHQLRCIYQASTFNIQAVPSGAIHQRLIEGLCCGGFFLIRRTPSDDVAALQESVRDRCIAMGLRTEDELWNIADEALAADVRRVNDALFAPARLYDGFVADQYFDAEHGMRMQAGTLLPHYEDVRFGTREAFERVVARFIDDADARREVAARQREAVVDQFSYETVLERLFDFAEERFATLAAERATPCVSTA